MTQTIRADQTFAEVHNCRIVSTIDPDAWKKEIQANEVRRINGQRKSTNQEPLEIPPHDGWTHQLFALKNPRRVDNKLVHDGIAECLGDFPTLAAALAQAKQINPPEPLPAPELASSLEE